VKKRKSENACNTHKHNGTLRTREGISFTADTDISSEVIYIHEHAYGKTRQEAMQSIGGMERSRRKVPTTEGKDSGKH
jgi:hypothetical protein